ncbi:MAG: type II secretion system protein [Candidatus Omnitrophota bacterium]|nr:type II secretion system protein [Candidatus Omnitrophota bacterium]
MFSRKGFTILELLIVIAVIAILVGIALPRFRGMQDEGNIAKAKGELRMLQTAVESYYIHNNSTLPATTAALTTAVPQIAPTVLPTDPFGGAAYGYNQGTTFFVLYSVGPSLNGAATINAAGTVTEVNGSSCVYVTNGGPVDTTP